MYTREHCVCVCIQSYPTSMGKHQLSGVPRQEINTDQLSCNSRNHLKFLFHSFIKKKKGKRTCWETLNFSDISPPPPPLSAGWSIQGEGGWIWTITQTQYIVSHTEWLYMDIVAIVALLLSFVPSNSLYNISLLLQLCVCRLIGQ